MNNTGSIINAHARQFTSGLARFNVIAMTSGDLEKHSSYRISKCSKPISDNMVRYYVGLHHVPTKRPTYSIWYNNFDTFKCTVLIFDKDVSGDTIGCHAGGFTFGSGSCTKGHDTLKSFLSKVAFESRFRKKISCVS